MTAIGVIAVPIGQGLSLILKSLLLLGIVAWLGQDGLWGRKDYARRRYRWWAGKYRSRIEESNQEVLKTAKVRRGNDLVSAYSSLRRGPGHDVSG